MKWKCMAKWVMMVGLVVMICGEVRGGGGENAEAKPSKENGARNVCLINWTPYPIYIRNLYSYNNVRGASKKHGGLFGGWLYNPKQFEEGRNALAGMEKGAVMPKAIKLPAPVTRYVGSVENRDTFSLYVYMNGQWKSEDFEFNSNRTWDVYVEDIRGLFEVRSWFEGDDWKISVKLK